ncbi:hypothetical protein H2199_001817 [Coniosporium tulheliwenetii]|uniref:Uncharacterized protein n=1 Tax=Coniosporium tulheliwenetii TaxID=3383036 RepID=A0ACC2ZKI6_9PEZI|nr:hypothetical protein H2199_001817 [Cladosporium sp. JES 115]
MSSKPPKHIQPTLTSTPIIPDPAAPGTIMRYALGIEAAINLLGCAGMLFFPSRFLNLLASKPSEITATATTVTQWLGALGYILTVPMLLAIPNTRRGIESRTTAGRVGDEQEGLLLGMGSMLPHLPWRAWVLFRRPEWIGRYREERKED